MGLRQGFGDGQSQSAASVRGPGFVGPVKPIKHLARITGTPRPQVVEHLQTDLPAGRKVYGDGSFVGAVFGGVIQEDVRQLPEAGLTAPDPDARLNPAGQLQAPLEVHGLEGKDRVGYQRAEVQELRGGVQAAGIQPGESAECGLGL